MLALAFLISTLSFLVYGQTAEDCREMYQQCYKDSIQKMMNRHKPSQNNQGFNPDGIMSTTPHQRLESWDPNSGKERLSGVYPDGTQWVQGSKGVAPVRPIRPTQSSTTTKRPSQSADSENELDDCLAAHNKFRAAHGVPALKAPSAELQAYADKRGLELATTDKFAHSANSPYGENLFMGYGKDYTCADAVQAWYDEIKDYNFKNPGFSSATGHFTAVVWKDTTQVACAVTKSKKTGYSYVVVSI